MCFYFIIFCSVCLIISSIILLFYYFVVYFISYFYVLFMMLLFYCNFGGFCFYFAVVKHFVSTFWKGAIQIKCIIIIIIIIPVEKSS